MQDHLWYPEVFDLLSKTSHVFMHNCAFHRVDGNGSALLAEAIEHGFSPERFFLNEGARFAPKENTDLAILLRMELKATAPRSLEQIRALVNEWVLRADGKVLIVSAAPRSAFPIGDGSSLVTDSLSVHLRSSRYAEWFFEDLKGVDDLIAESAASSRGFASRVQADAAEVSTARLIEIADEVAQETLGELGPSYISLLDEWVLDRRQLAIPVEDIPEWMQQELILAGAARMDDDQQSLELFQAALGASWAAGLRYASRSCTAATEEWRDTAAALFEVERLVRMKLANALESKLGAKWARQSLTKDEVSYIQQSGGFTVESELDRLANPLDFLTLGQLVDVCERKSDLAGSVGLSRARVNEIRRLIPIRNRCQHMRLPRSGDRATARSILSYVRLAS